MAEIRTRFEKRMWEITDSLRGVIDPNAVPRLALLILSTRKMAQGERWKAESHPAWQDVITDPSGRSLRDALYIARFALASEDSESILGDATVDLVVADHNALAATQALARFLDDVASVSGASGAAEALLDYIRSMGGVQSGEYMTPPDLRHLVARLVAEGTGPSFYDPACGTAGLLLDICREIVRIHPEVKPQPYGQELNRETASLARMNLFLHDYDASEIRTGNTLTQPAHVDGDRLRQFDRIATVLPMGMRLSKKQRDVLIADPIGRFHLADPGSSPESAFLQHIVASLPEEGVAAVVLSPGFLFRAGYEQKLRKALVRSGFVKTVISLPAVLAGTSVHPVLLLLGRPSGSGQIGDIQFVSADGFYSVEGHHSAMSATDVEKIVSLVQTRECVPGVSALVAAEAVLANEATLTPAQYAVEQEVPLLFGEHTKSVRLGDIATITRGARVKTAKEPAGGIPVLRGRDLRQVSVSPEDLAETEAEEDLSGVQRVEAGDVLVQRIGEHPAAMCVDESLSGSIPADSVLQIRLDDAHRELAPFLVDYLNSEPGQAALSSRVRGTGAPYVHIPSLQELPVPIPSGDVVRLVNGLRGIEVELVDRVARTRAIRKRLFTRRDEEEAQSELASLNAEQQVLAASLLKVDDPPFRIRNFYPYPLAFPYRMLEPISNAVERYPAQLSLTESVLAYVGCLGLALLAHAGGTLSEGNHPLSLESLRKHWRGGISPGDWQAIGRESGRALRDLSGDPLSAAFAGLWFKGRRSKESLFAERTKELVNLKNDFKHDRGPKTPPDFEDSCEHLQGLLNACLEDLAFLVPHPLFLTETPDVDRMTKEVTIPVLNCSGDHPAFDREQHFYDVALPKDTLYARAEPNNWARLFPLVTVQYCPTCKNRAFFIIDRWDGPEDRVILKSLERGHPMDSASDNRRVATEAKEIGRYFGAWLQDLDEKRTKPTEGPST